MAGVALVGVTVVGAGAPGLLATAADLNESQGLVTFAQLNRQAVTLAHSLADERDEVTQYVAAGRGAPRDTDAGAGSGGTGSDGTADGGAGSGTDQDRSARGTRPPAAHTARVDRQIDEIRAAAPEDLRRVLAGIPELRRSALTGTGTALEVHRAYTEVIGKLQGLAAEFAHRTPARADTTGRAPAELGQATERAAATRGLLLAALAVPGTDAPDRVEFDPVTGTYRTREDPAAVAAARDRDALSSAAHLTRVREQVALAEFDQEADTAARESLSATVTGPEVTAAEKYLDALTDRPELSEKEQRTDPEELEAALTARVEQMRGVESALATGRVESMERLRDADVTTLELRIALLGGCLLVAIGVSTAVARSLTRPLAVLRLGAARLAASPETEEPVRFTGRNDEFAQVVRSLNTLHGKVAALAARAERPGTPATRQDAPVPGDGPVPGDVPVQAGAAEPAPQGAAAAGQPAGARQDAADAAAEAEREALAAQLTALRAEVRADTERLTAELERLRRTADETAATSVNLSLRALGLVERQLTVIEALEEREQDPERLASLFQLDHMATVMRRHCENLLILSGHEHRHAHEVPVPLVDVLRAAVSEIEQYGRVAIQSLPPHTFVSGDAADDLSHLLAELLENATAFSPEGARVQLSAWLLEDGDVMLSVRDKGAGIPLDRRSLLNARLAEPSAPGDAADDGADGGLGLRVASLLAARHGVRVELREDEQGGATALVVLPRRLLPDAAPWPPHPRSPSRRARPC
ncbi:nitrate- and nitrite sensing domain-containing protein [Streptomyces sp. CC228A]|uniref:sensor histidine kinase n=1 Tax=Streptomyces sp. CC228A TaxID=2898186 RepID=UPI001F2202E6